MGCNGMQGSAAKDLACADCESGYYQDAYAPFTLQYIGVPPLPPFLFLTVV